MYSFCQPSVFFSGFFNDCDIRYVLMLRYSARNQVACQVLGISIYAISSVKIYFFQFDVFTFLLFSLFRPFSLSVNPFTFFIVFFFIVLEFFPKFLNLFYRSFCGFDALFPYLTVEFLRINLRYFILSKEFRPFFKPSDSFYFDLFPLFYYFFCRFYVLSVMQFVFSLTFCPFLVFN